MPRIAISGHRGLPGPTTTVVDSALRAKLAKHNPDDLVGVSCIADGADTLFAQAVLDHGGRLEVVIPAQEYRAGLPVEHHPTYDRLLSAATAVHRLPYRESTSEAHMAASELMLEHADQLYAVWDGLPARGYGGTADVVTTAHRVGLPVTVIWPNGATRD
jgi:hypothetical protein